jgi:hypothetical protein
MPFTCRGLDSLLRPTRRSSPPPFNPTGRSCPPIPISGPLLASTKATAPSIIVLRRQSNWSVTEVAALIQANIDAIADPIEAGSVVVLEESRIRIRQLPLA